jgi:ABC-2 type transport system ATP-binding protein
VIVTAEKLTHRYGTRTALNELSFSVPKGQIFGVLGPNGGGKSTLFSILSTLIAPAAGRVEIAGADVVRQAAEVRRQIGVVFQSQSLDRKLTVNENLTSQGHLYGMSGEGLRKRVAESMERLSLKDRANDIVDTLSGGLKRRVEIAKALLHHPAVLLMDEPSTGLDPGARHELWKYVEELRNHADVTVLLTTHILDEADRCDSLLLLHEGRKVAEGTPVELKSKVGGDVVVLEVSDPAAMEAQIAVRFGVKPHLLNGTLRVEIANGHRFLTEVVEAFPGTIHSIAMHKPTLEDVFLDETGVRIGE